MAGGDEPGRAEGNGGAHAVSVRRQWAPWRTPWVWRKIRSRARPHRASRDSTVALFRYEGRPDGVGSFIAGACDQLLGGSFLDASGSAHPGAYLAGEVTQAGLTSGAEALLSVSGAVGDGGSVLTDIDEAAVVILAAVAVAIVLIVAIPLGILAVEVVLGLLVVLIGVSLRVAHVRPWTILVRRDERTIAAFSVTGWRASCQMVRGLREQQDAFLLDRPSPGAARESGRFRPADDPSLPSSPGSPAGD